jgi:aminoglycoside phosphotransferase (APT) family kinase protein
MSTSFTDPTAQRLEPITKGADPEVVGPLLAEALHDERWLGCDVALISGGKSNLTYRVGSDAGEVVLRRPPLGHVLPTAHDMVREYRVQAALEPTPVPVARMLYLGADDGVLGASYYVMERVLGHICRNALPPGYADTPQEREAIGGALVEALARLHSVAPEAVGLADFGRPGGFMERQLRRWSEQWQRSKVADIPVLDGLRDELARTLPPQGRSAIVHGDYRLDNTILHPTRPGAIVAVLDWEMSTLGDPLADLGALLAYWSSADDDEVLTAARMMPPLTEASGFPSREEVVSAYAEMTGFDVSGLPWYRAFAYFKLAVICQGIAARAAGGRCSAPGSTRRRAWSSRSRERGATCWEPTSSNESDRCLQRFAGTRARSRGLYVADAWAVPVVPREEPADAVGARAPRSSLRPHWRPPSMPAGSVQQR